MDGGSGSLCAASPRPGATTSADIASVSSGARPAWGAGGLGLNRLDVLEVVPAPRRHGHVQANTSARLRQQQCVVGDLHGSRRGTFNDHCGSSTSPLRLLHAGIHQRAGNSALTGLARKWKPASPQNHHLRRGGLGPDAVEVRGQLVDERPWAERPQDLPVVHDLELAAVVSLADLVWSAAWRSGSTRIRTASARRSLSLSAVGRGAGGPGMDAAMQERLGVPCTHLRELARAMAPVLVRAAFSRVCAPTRAGKAMRTGCGRCFRSSAARAHLGSRRGRRASWMPAGCPVRPPIRCRRSRTSWTECRQCRRAHGVGRSAVGQCLGSPVEIGMLVSRRQVG